MPVLPLIVFVFGACAVVPGAIIAITAPKKGKQKAEEKEYITREVYEDSSPRGPLD